MIVRSLSFLLLLFLNDLVASKDDFMKNTVRTSGEKKSQREGSRSWNVYLPDRRERTISMKYDLKDLRNGKSGNV